MHGGNSFQKEEMLSGDAGFMGNREENVRTTLRQHVTGRNLYKATIIVSKPI